MASAVCWPGPAVANTGLGRSAPVASPRPPREEHPISAPVLDLTTPRRIHLVGIGGTGLSAIAIILAEMGHRVSGSDAVDSVVLARLAARGIETSVGHRPEHVGDVHAVAVSTAVPHDNPEVVAAARAGVPVLRRAEILAAMCGARRTLAVAGTHGKTTTTAMLAAILVEGGLDPSWLVGADVPALGAPGHWGAGELFVVEADESDGTFLELGADAAIVTNVEADHLDHHGSVERLNTAFADFVAAVPGLVVLNADDPVAAALRPGAVTFGESGAATYRMCDLALQRSSVELTLQGKVHSPERLRLPLPGRHNAANAVAAAAAAIELGVPPPTVAGALAHFGGVARRWQHRGEVAGVTFVDDYSHLPTEVRAALAAARAGEWGRVVCVFQPHRYTRTADLWSEFAEAFDDADVLAVTDVYAAGQAPIPGVSGKLIVDAVLAARPGKRVAWLPRRRDVITWLGAELRAGDLCITLGAGDVTTVADEVTPRLVARS